MGPDAEAVMKDLATDINMPFVLSWDKENEELDLIAKTVMRKPDFKTSNREFAVEKDQLNEWVQIPLWAVATAVRVGGPTLIKLAKFGWKKIIKPGAVNTTKVIVQNPVKAAAAYGVYDVLTDVGEYVKEIKDMVGDAIDDLSIQSLAELAWKNKLPLAAVAAVLYGGSKLKSYMKDNPEDGEGNTTINNYYYGDEPATEGLEEQETLIPYVSMDWGLWKAAQRGRISFDERLSQYIDNAGGQASEGHLNMWARFKKNHGIKNMSTDVREETFLYQKMKDMKEWEYPRLEEALNEFTISDLKYMGITHITPEQKKELQKISHENDGNITRSDLKKIGLLLQTRHVREEELDEWSWRQPFSFPRPDVVGKPLPARDSYGREDVKTIELPIGLAPGKLNASKKSKKNEEETVNEYDFAEIRQKRIAIDTVKNPSKALLGGPSVDEAESILKTKFGYSDKQIAKLKESIKEKQEKKEDLLKGFDPKTARAIMMLKAKYPQADNILSALLADVENNEKDSDVTDLSQDYKMEKLSKAVDVLQKEINLLKRDKTQNARNTPKESVLKEESGIHKFNKEDPNNPEVVIQGYGTLLLNQIEDDLVRNFNSLEHMAKRKEWDGIDYQLNKTGVMQAKLEAIISTKEQLQAIRRKGGPKSRGITKESLYDILIGEDKEMGALDESFEKLSRKFQVARHNKAYKRAADTLHEVLKRKYQENEGNWRHALGWYVAKIASGFNGVKTRVLEDYYLENYESAFIESVTEAGGVGKVVPGVNTSVDVGPNEIKTQAKKFGNDVDKDGVPKKNLR
jgi:hypothetical protein